ncbi:hypothetical protein ABT120_35625 [Nonomuraea angiospora]|uniref:hypothetical protein n=1 Tax=Nonomuraea angiospora TaxID=46172 RepID=UPI0033313952
MDHAPSRRAVLGGTMAGLAVPLLGGAPARAATAQAAGPIGSGWTEIFPTYSVHQPPDRTRHTYDAATGEHHFWVYDTDPYFKAGLYGRAGMSARSDNYLKNIHIYRK